MVLGKIQKKIAPTAGGNLSDHLSAKLQMQQESLAEPSAYMIGILVYAFVIHVKPLMAHRSLVEQYAYMVAIPAALVVHGNLVEPSGSVIVILVYLQKLLRLMMVGSPIDLPACLWVTLEKLLMVVTQVAGRNSSELSAYSLVIINHAEQLDLIAQMAGRKSFEPVVLRMLLDRVAQMPGGNPSELSACCLLVLGKLLNLVAGENLFEQSPGLLSILVKLVGLVGLKVGRDSVHQSMILVVLP